MTIQQKLISIGGEVNQNKIILKNIEIPFYIPSEELKESYFDLLTGKFRKLSFDYKKQLEKYLDKLEIRKPKKQRKLTDELTQKQKDELNKHLNKQAFDLIIFSLSKKYKISILQAKEFLREMFLQLLYKCNDRENIKVYNLILNFIIRICNKSDSLESVKSEILATGENEIKKYLNKIA